MLDTLFAEFTSLHFHVAWSQPAQRGKDARSMPTGFPVCCQANGSPFPECRTCGQKHLGATLDSDCGHRFTCGLGVRNYWLPVRIRRETPGIASLQALRRSVTRSPCKPGARAVRARLRRAGVKVLTGLKFARAARFLRLIVQYVQTASLSELRKADLSSAGRAVVALEREQTRLHETLHRHLPSASQVPRSSGPESHPEQVVHGLLERIELDYAKPITLRRFARDLDMNAAYLSALFSRAVGIPFKTYLTELRLQKARELLGDAARTASDVACAVGYASEDRFRFAFKQATGLSPKAWRETMQSSPPDRSA